MQSSTDYQTIFQAGLIRGLRAQCKTIGLSRALNLNDETRTQAWTLLDCALSVPPDADFTMPELWPAICDFLLALGPIMEPSGYWDQWTIYLETGIQWSEFAQDRIAEAMLRLHLGTLARLQGQLDKASQVLLHSRELYKNLQIDNGAATALNWLGYIARLQNDYDLADSYTDEALSLLPEDDSERELSYFVRGTVAYGRRDWQKAVGFFKHSLALCEQAQDTHKTAKRLRDLGATFEKQGKCEDAAHCYQQAIRLLEQVSDSYHCAITQMNLGNVYTQPQLALELYSKAKAVLSAVLDERHLAMLFNNQAFAYYELQQWTDAEQACLASIAQWEAVGDLESSANVMDGLGLIYRAQNKRKQAMQIFQKALKRLDKINSQNSYLVKLITQHLND